MSVQEYGRVPFVPESVLRKYKVHEPSDTRFRSAARLRQALFREQHGWPIGMFRAAKGKPRKIGSYLGDSAADLSANFISSEVAHLVRREIAYREDHALIEQDRLWNNMLSSQPAVFNVFGPLKLDLRLASKVMRRLCPDLVRGVTDVLFEHSPSRRDPAFTNDRTAFDAFIKCRTAGEENEFVAVEVKYSETMAETPARLRPRYDQLSRECGLFRDPDHPALREAPLQQLWRQHMLAAAMILRGLYSSGRFVVIAPAYNSQAQDALRLYRAHLTDESCVTFDVITLESLIKAIGRSGAAETAALLHDRYSNFEPVGDLI